jgi:hypothetical protein
MNALCNYNFDLPGAALPLLETMAHQVEEYGGVVTGELPEVAISIPTAVGRIEGRAAS